MLGRTHQTIKTTVKQNIVRSRKPTQSGEAAGGSGHLEELSGAVEELRALETNATISFYTMQREFAGAAKR